MTELQGAIGKVQLKKLKYIINRNKLRFEIIEKLLKSKFEIRQITKNSTPNFDTFIFFEKNKKIREKILKRIKYNNFGTKNLPDAIKWHCSSYWNHALPYKQVRRSVKTQRLLKQAIAIPINLGKTLKDYTKLSKDILSVKK